MYVPTQQDSMRVGHVVVQGEDLFEVVFVWEDVGHPGKHIGVLRAMGIINLEI